MSTPLPMPVTGQCGMRLNAPAGAYDRVRVNGLAALGTPRVIYRRVPITEPTPAGFFMLYFGEFAGAEPPDMNDSNLWLWSHGGPWFYHDSLAGSYYGSYEFRDVVSILTTDLVTAVLWAGKTKGVSADLLLCR